MRDDGTQGIEFTLNDHHEVEAWASALSWRIVVASTDAGVEWIGIRPEYADENLFQLYPERGGLICVLRSPEWNNPVRFKIVAEALASIRLLDATQRAAANAYRPAWRRPII